jgi:uncharacterized protein
MTADLIITASLLFFIIALLYSSVGHAGASGYLAIMALLSFPVAMVKPLSLMLNILVATIASWQFISKGRFDKNLFLWFAMGSIPTSFLGGYTQLEPTIFKISAGLFLILSAIFLFLRNRIKFSKEKGTPPNFIMAVGIGGIIGFVSGLIGVGGGIFLSPVILLLGWAGFRETSGIAALFILINSILGLSGHYIALRTLPWEVFYYAGTVIIGGYIGARMGSTSLPGKVVYFLLILVLLSAGIKFVWLG